MNNLRARKNEQCSPNFSRSRSRNFGVLIRKVAVSQSLRIGCGPGGSSSFAAIFRFNPGGISPYSVGRAVMKGRLYSPAIVIDSQLSLPPALWALWVHRGDSSRILSLYTHNGAHLLALRCGVRLSLLRDGFQLHS